MAKYTTELRDIVKSGLNIFDFPYVFYDETKKADFEQKFINHFYFREIGQETVGRFKHYLKCKCDETLPYYNMLFTTAQMEYDLLNNYNLTETFTKTNTVTKETGGNATQNGTLHRASEVEANGDKTNTLDSTTEHTENTDFTKDETVTETGEDNRSIAVTVDNRKVQSDTPNGLLSMPDIKGNVYASKAEIEDGTTSTTDNDNTSAEKKGNSIENTTSNVSDVVNATSHDTTNDNNTEDTTETTNNTTNTTQNETGNGTENYTLTRIGNIGVDKPSDMLQKHIEFQKTMTTIYSQFFNECEDLFMQIF